MGISVAFVALPKINGRFILCEDCCGNSSTAHVLPGLLLSCASEAKANGINVSFIDLSIDENADLSQYDYAVYAKPWLYHDDVEEEMSLRVRQSQKIIIAIPSGYADDYNYCMNDGSICTVQQNYESAITEMLVGKKRNFDEIAPVDYSIVPSHYWKHYNSAIYQVTRGCPYRCKFCAWGGSTVSDRTYLMRNPETVASNINDIVTLAGKRLTVSLLCSQLTIRNDWLESFCEKSCGYEYSTNVNLAEVTENNIDMLKQSGCVCVTAGMEGLSSSVLQRIWKGFSFEKLLSSVSILDKSDIDYKLHFRFGFGESDSDIDEQKRNLVLLRNAMKNSNTRRVSVGPMIHYKGTLLYDECGYNLVEHPDVKHAMIQDGINWEKWVDFAVEASRLGLLKKLRRFPKQCVKLWRKRCEDFVN